MKKLYRPGFARILDWLEGRLPEEEARRIAAEMDSAGDEAQQDLMWLQSFLEMRAEMKLASPPKHLREKLRSRFSDYALERRPPNLFQRLQGSLSFDSQSMQVTAGLRATASAESKQRQMVYATKVAEIVLNIQPHPQGQRYNLYGQVFPVASFNLDEFIVQLLKDSIDHGLTTTDELGEFSFEDLTAGTYEVILIASHYEVSLSPIQLSPG